MNVLIAGLYAVILWLSLLAYTIILDGFWPVVVLAGPLIVAGCMTGLLALALLVDTAAQWLRPARRRPSGR